MRLSPEEVMALAPVLGFEIEPTEAEAVSRRLRFIAEAVEEARAQDLRPNDAPFEVAPMPTDGRHRSGTPAVGSGPARAAPSSDAGGELTSLPIASLAPLIRSRAVSPVEVAEAYLARIDRFDGPLNSFITVTADRALSDARRAEREIAAGGYRGAMHGVPIGHKDLISTKGIRTTFNTEHFKDHVPTVDAAVVTRLDEAGSVLLGKLNTYEFGNGVGDVFGPARNPWDTTREAGGSSSGSGAAVSADLVAGATGSDAAGSIRVPSAFCGVVGLKPTFGVVGRFPESWSSVTMVGPMTKTVTDAAIMLEWMVDPPAGGAPRWDYRSLADRLDLGTRDLSIGVPRRWLELEIDDEVERAYQDVVAWYEDAGARVVDIELPHAAWSQSIGTVTTTAEGFAALRPLLERGVRISTYVRQTIITSQLISAYEALLAKAARQVLIDEVRRAHEDVDLIITPTLPYPAYRFDKTELSLKGGTVNARANLTVFGRMANLTGFPAVSVPCGFNRIGLPLGFQLMGRPFEEQLLLGAAAAYEADTRWYRHKPPLPAVV